MILTALIYIALAIINAILFVFPTGGGLPDSVHASAGYFGSYLGILSPIAPLETLSTAVLLIIYVELAILLFRFFKWAFSHVPAIGGRG